MSARAGSRGERLARRAAGVRVRRAGRDDRGLLAALAPRLAPTRLPAWRDARRAAANGLAAIDVVLAGHGPQVAVWVAEDARGVACGILHARMAIDRISGDVHVQLVALLVDRAADPGAIVAALHDAARTWAAARGCRGFVEGAYWARRAADDAAPVAGQPSSVAPGTSHSESDASATPMPVAASTSLG